MKAENAGAIYEPQHPRENKGQGKLAPMAKKGKTELGRRDPLGCRDAQGKTGTNWDRNYPHKGKSVPKEGQAGKKGSAGHRGLGLPQFEKRAEMHVVCCLCATRLN